MYSIFFYMSFLTVKYSAQIRHFEPLASDLFIKWTRDHLHLSPAFWNTETFSEIPIQNCDKAKHRTKVYIKCETENQNVQKAVMVSKSTQVYKDPRLEPALNQLCDNLIPHYANLPLTTNNRPYEGGATNEIASEKILTNRRAPERPLRYSSDSGSSQDLSKDKLKLVGILKSPGSIVKHKIFLRSYSEIFFREATTLPKTCWVPWQTGTISQILLNNPLNQCHRLHILLLEI